MIQKLSAARSDMIIAIFCSRHTIDLFENSHKGGRLSITAMRSDICDTLIRLAKQLTSGRHPYALQLVGYRYTGPAFVVMRKIGAGNGEVISDKAYRQILIGIMFLKICGDLLKHTVFFTYLMLRLRTYKVQGFLKHGADFFPFPGCCTVHDP